MSFDIAKCHAMAFEEFIMILRLILTVLKRKRTTNVLKVRAKHLTI